ncbi:hypothetical protein V6N12_008467 [Hibiscus sabdariffa]|uniref:Putative E3 ubiquitin-protein ligase LIN N-terminal domain-containing protein n=1 Tax=Hibiscus sabdariffa TaxID=183260 RepID=A0ABR2BIX8_9ROSI
MSENSVSPPPASFLVLDGQPDIESMRVVVNSINRYVSWLAVLSNLYWVINGIEAALQADSEEDRANQLKESEKMLQVPALLDEQGITAGVPNEYLVCCSYFYLSVIKNLQNDQLQAALRYLQALLVSPMLVQTEFTSKELCESLFLPDSDRREIGGIRRLKSVSSNGSGWGNLTESTRQTARRYKHWLMYHLVMLYGKTTQLQNECNDILSPVYRSMNFR